MTKDEALKLALVALDMMVTPRSFQAQVRIKEIYDSIREVLAQPEQEPMQCEPQEAVTEDGWCEWVCPKPVGYLMQCCDCGLIHEVESRVAKYEPRPSEVFEVVNDPDLQVQWRMRRRDDWAPEDTAYRPGGLAQPEQEPVAIVHIKDGCLAGSHRDASKPFPDGQYGLWPITTPPQRKPPQFPTMLRKMWSGTEVQEWINENWK